MPSEGKGMKEKWVVKMLSDRGHFGGLRTLE
jgi:hypothetical protein